VADNLSRALGAIPAEKLEGGDKYLKELYIGVEMTVWSIYGPLLSREDSQLDCLTWISYETRREKN